MAAPIKCTLLAMPWASSSRPSAANAALSAYVRTVRPSIDVECRSEYLVVADRLGAAAYDFIADHAYALGDVVYACLLYPEKESDARAWFTEYVSKERPELGAGDVFADAEAEFDRIRGILAEHLEEVARSLVAHRGVVGLTTSFGQLFANLCVARRIKELGGTATIVLGGSTVSSSAGRSILDEYAFVDAIVQGEGERPLVEVLDALLDPVRAPRSPSVLMRGRRALLKPITSAPSEVPSLDELPMPDYDEYAARADALGIEWALPLEGSRGCWWDRVRRTGNPKDTCFFCNLNLQWQGYREKSVDRVADEVATLTARHQNLNVFFVDNIVRAKGAVELAHRLKASGRQLSIFYEARANLRPLELLELWEAGLVATQFGIEALSTSILRRIGKGTTTIQNLQAMRLCAELGIENKANLIVGFPGTTPEEIAESAQNIRDYALAYEPLNLAKFHLGLDSTVHVLREELGLTNVRNADYYRHGVPADVLERLVMMDFDFDTVSPQASWAPIEDAVREWRRIHRERPGARLVYRDGGDFLVIEDARADDDRRGTFEGTARSIYLACLEIQRVSLLPRLVGIGASEVEDVLGRFVEDRLVFREGDHALSLAVAPAPRIAAARIRAAAEVRRTIGASRAA